jgi:hypothetical protein
LADCSTGTSIPGFIFTRIERYLLGLVFGDPLFMDMRDACFRVNVEPSLYTNLALSAERLAELPEVNLGNALKTAASYIGPIYSRILSA